MRDHNGDISGAKDNAGDTIRASNGFDQERQCGPVFGPSTSGIRQSSVDQNSFAVVFKTISMRLPVRRAMAPGS
ncbi:hypothetical protein MRX96_040151 [Rhipicephalus microplus]